MLGGFQEQSSLDCNYLQNLFYQRKPANEFFKFSSFTVPATVDEAFSRTKINIPKFLFYYICVLSAGFLLAILTKFILLVPVSIIAAGFILSRTKFDLASVEIKPEYSIYGSIGIVFFLSLIFGSIASSYLVLISFLSIATIVILTHSCLLESTNIDNTNTNVPNI